MLGGFVAARESARGFPAPLKVQAARTIVQPERCGAIGRIAHAAVSVDHFTLCSAIRANRTM
jgi:hypothetical protein